MKKVILLATLLSTQMSFASNQEKVDACFAKVKSLSSNLITAGVEERVNYNPTQRSTTFKGTEADGKSCIIFITEASYESSGDQGAHDQVTFSLYSSKGYHYSFRMMTYHDYFIFGKVNFKVAKCNVDPDNLTANVAFATTSKEMLTIVKKDYGIVEFNFDEGVLGILGFLDRADATRGRKCTVDLNNQ